MKIGIEVEVPMEESVELMELLEQNNRYFKHGARMVATNIILFENVETEEHIECEMFDLLTEFKTMLKDNRIIFEETPL